ncbi:endonuclease III domain-containing protein [Mesorhizobium australicum]|uniref:endonuclease III domain-containing protein n=1 Tax=Mesorhizobium australicum TaxID=536018 RepID=UPI00333BA8FF
MTTGPSYERVYNRLKAAVPNWSQLLKMDLTVLKALIGDAGLANQKAPRMVAIANQLARDFGEVTLEPLQRMTDRDAETFLTTLPGVGLKTAKCVLMYSLGRELLPVDTHVARVSRRLMLVGDAPSRLFVANLEPAVPPDCRYDYHVNVLQHGRELCRPMRPKCPECPLWALCPSAGYSQRQSNAG